MPCAQFAEYLQELRFKLRELERSGAVYRNDVVVVFVAENSLRNNGVLRLASGYEVINRHAEKGGDSLE